MSPVFEFLFEPYKAYSWATIGIEITAVLFGFASVWYSKQNKIAVFQRECSPQHFLSIFYGKRAYWEICLSMPTILL